MSSPANKTAEPATAAPASPGRSKVLLISAVVLAAAASAGGTYFVSQRQFAAQAPVDGEAEAEQSADSHDSKPDAHGGGHADAAVSGKSKGAAAYQPLAPSFVVNLADTDASRYLMVDMEVMARKGSPEAAITENLPSIRNALLMLLSQQSSSSLHSREGKEALRQAALTEIQAVLTRETGKPVIEAVFFTSFVVQ